MTESNALKNEYDEKFAKFPLPDEPEKFIVENLHYLKEMNCHAVLDLGCGTGRDAVFLAKKGFKVTAVDFSSDGLRLARERIERNNCAENVKLVQEDFAKLDLGDSSFDCVIANKSLHYFSTDAFAEILGKVFKALKPGGILVLRIYSVEDPQYKAGKKLGEKYYHAGDHARRFYNKSELQELLYKFNTITFTKNVSNSVTGKLQVNWAVVAQKPVH